MKRRTKLLAIDHLSFGEKYSVVIKCRSNVAKMYFKRRLSGADARMKGREFGVWGVQYE